MSLWGRVDARCAFMSAHCPNCEAEVALAAPACISCGAQFGADGWKPVTSDDEVAGGGAETCAMIAGAAGLLAWIAAVGMGAVGGLREMGSLNGFWLYFRPALHGGLAGGLAYAALFMGLLTLIVAKGKLIPWTGLAGGALLLLARYFI